MIKEEKKEIIFEGSPASSGVAIGKAFVLSWELFEIPHLKISPENVKSEKNRFRNAIKNVKKNLYKEKETYVKLYGSDFESIYDIQLGLLEDIVAIENVEMLIENQRKCAEWAIEETSEHFINMLKDIPDEYMKQRKEDIKHIGMKLIEELVGKKREGLEKMNTPKIVIFPELDPTQALKLDKTKVLGVATDHGGINSHSSIIVRSLGIPMVIGLKNLTLVTKKRDPIILDGDSGKVILYPSEKTKRLYTKKIEVQRRIERILGTFINLPAITKDGHKVKLLANIEFHKNLDVIKESGAEGVGLFRTEYLTYNRAFLLDGDSQFEVYSSVSKTLNPLPVTIRVFDLPANFFEKDYFEPVPIFGWRSIRYFMKNPKYLKEQLKAIIRASIYGNISILIPFISTIDEILFIKELINEIKKEFKEKRIKFAAKIPLGIMIETPASALKSEEFAKHCDFFSIGSNDLTQFTLAVDRTNEEVYKYHSSFDPAVLKLIEITINSAKQAKIPVAVCGELASNLFSSLLLFGLGVEELSLFPKGIPMLKLVIRESEFDFIQKVSKDALSLKTSEEVYNYLKDNFGNIIDKVKTDLNIS